MDIHLSAISNGYNVLFEYLVSTDDIQRNSTLKIIKYKTQAAEYGELDILKYIHENGGSCWNKQVSRSAIENGHVHVLKYIHEKGGPVSESIVNLSDVAKNGHLNVIIYFRDTGLFPLSKIKIGTINYNAACNGHIHILQYLHENNNLWSESASRGAAFGGHLKILKYLQANEYPWAEDVCTHAAKNGQLDVVKYLCEEGWACFYAAKQGYFEILKYLHENGCPWGTPYQDCYLQRKDWKADILKYLRENGYSCGEENCCYCTK